MDNFKIIDLLVYLLLLTSLASCSSSQDLLDSDIQVLTASDTLIRFSYELDSDRESSIANYASKYCSQLNVDAVRGARTCDGVDCEITYFCETDKN